MGKTTMQADATSGGPPAPRGRYSTSGRLRSDLPRAIMTMLLLLLPLYRTGILEDSFITPKLMLVIAVGTLAGLALLVRPNSPSHGCLTGRCAGSGLAFGGLVVWHMVAVAWAPAHGLAVSSMAWWLSFFSLYHLIRLTAADTKAVATLWGAAVVAAAATAVWVLAEDAGRGALSGGVMARLPDWRGYLSAGLGNSGHIAGYIGYCVPAAIIWFLLRRRLSVVGFIGLSAMFSALVVTWSVGSTASALVALIIWGTIAARSSLRRRLKWRRLALLAAGGVAVSAFYLLPHPLNPHPHGLWAEAFASQRWKEGGPTRLAIYLTTWHMIREKPILGVGAGNFTHAYVQQSVQEVANDPRLRPYAGAFTNDAHNEFLHIWCETGLPGLLLLLGTVLLFYRETWQSLRDSSPRVAAIAVAAGGAMTALLLDAIMTFPMRLPAHLTMFVLCLATAAILPRGRALCASPARSHRLLVAGLVLVPFLIAGSIHSRRVAAEYCFKRARVTAESGVMIPGRGMFSPWNTADSLFTEATSLIAMGQDQEAASRLERVAGLCRLPQMTEAKELMRRALAWDPGYTNASSRYGALLLMSQDYAKARHYLIVTLRNLQAPEVHERLGFAYYLDRSGDALARALALKGAHEHWRLIAGRRPIMRPYIEALIAATGGKHG